MPTLLHEKRHGCEDGKIVCGVDEVGRAPLAGPVMAAAVILPPQLPRAVRKEIRDSKKMTLEAREAIFEPLIQLCRYCIAEASVEEIGRINIFWASMLAMKRAVDGLCTLPSCPPKLKERRRMGRVENELPATDGNSFSGRGQEANPFKIDMALIDGNKIPPALPCPGTAIVAGDDKCLSIAAASIIAKVTRDRFMKKLAESFPGYGWETNVGYPTLEHREALRRLGPTEWHRPGFALVTQLELELDMAS